MCPAVLDIRAHSVNCVWAEGGAWLACVIADAGAFRFAVMGARF